MNFLLKFFWSLRKKHSIELPQATDSGKTDYVDLEVSLLLYYDYQFNSVHFMQNGSIFLWKLSRRQSIDQPHVPSQRSVTSPAAAKSKLRWTTYICTCIHIESIYNMQLHLCVHFYGAVRSVQVQLHHQTQWAIMRRGWKI